MPLSKLCICSFEGIWVDFDLGLLQIVNQEYSSFIRTQHSSLLGSQYIQN